MSTCPKTLTDDECKKLLIVLTEGFGSPKKQAKAVRNHAMAVLMLDAGLRVGEVVQLDVTDLWFNNAPVTSVLIRKEIAKNNQSRQIPVTDRLSNALKNMFEEYWSNTMTFGLRKAFVTSDQANPLTTRQVERIIRQASLKALGRPIHPHMLRHTFGSNLMRITNIRTVQELLGHRNLQSTQVYTHPNETDKIKAIACLQNGCVDTSEDLNALANSTRRPNGVNASGANQDH